jgi:D-glycero-D-manno-heptose 1,7-bisphosphate phosphatase
MKTAFLDRDGVINCDRNDYTWKWEQWEFVPEALAALKTLSEKGYQLIVITNQAGIAKGIYSHADVALLHDKMQKQMEWEGIVLKDIFYCPYYDSLSRSIWRKPDSGMLERAMALYKISASNAVFIGDTDRDMQAALKVGIKPVKVVPNTSWLSIAQNL